MARPQKFDREKVTKKARDLFWKKGYNAVSVQDLAQTMEISRSSFYNSFADKDTVFDEVLAAYMPIAPCAPLEDLKPGDPVIPAIKDMFMDICKNKAGDPEAKGCLMVNSIAALDQNNAPMKEILQKRMQGGMEHFTDVIMQAITQGEISADKDPKAIALYLITLQAGLCLLSKVCPDEAMLCSIAEQGFHVFEG